MLPQVPANVIRKLQILDQAEDFETDVAAAKALGVSRAALWKWRNQADYSSVFALIDSLAGKHGPCKKRKGPANGEELLIHEIAAYFPEYDSQNIADCLTELGYRTTHDQVRWVLSSLGLERRIKKDQSPPSPEAIELLKRLFPGFVPPPPEPPNTREAVKPLKGSELRDELFRRQLISAIRDHPIRFIRIIRQSLLIKMRYGIRLCGILERTAPEEKEEVAAIRARMRGIKERLEKMVITASALASKNPDEGT